MLHNLCSCFNALSVMAHTRVDVTALMPQWMSQTWAFPILCHHHYTPESDMTSFNHMFPVCHSTIFPTRNGLVVVLLYSTPPPPTGSHGNHCLGKHCSPSLCSTDHPQLTSQGAISVSWLGSHGWVLTLEGLYLTTGTTLSRCDVETST